MHGIAGFSACRKQVYGAGAGAINELRDAITGRDCDRATAAGNKSDGIWNRGPGSITTEIVSTAWASAAQSSDSDRPRGYSRAV